jgi:hypothetical protein
MTEDIQKSMNCLVVPFEIPNMTSMEQFRTELVNQLKNIQTTYIARHNQRQTTPHRLHGPMYALLAQAPFLRSSQGNTIYVHPHNMHEYRGLSLIDGTGQQKGLYVLVHLICPMYTKSYNVKNIGKYEGAFSHHMDTTLKPLLDNHIRASQCFLRCGGSNNSEFSCGCLNTDEPYNARCMGPAGNAGSEGQATGFNNYAMMYRVNERSLDLQALFDPNYRDDVRQ